MAAREFDPTELLSTAESTAFAINNGLMDLDEHRGEEPGKLRLRREFWHDTLHHLADRLAAEAAKAPRGMLREVD